MKLPRNQAMHIARLAYKLDSHTLIDILKQFPDEGRGTWGYFAKKLVFFLENPDSEPPFKIFVKGNTKLPFYSFSNLPLVNCPGKGQCAKWCYSLKAWRCPAAFFRQVQNTMLIRTKSVHITQAFNKLPKSTDVRLYVDGDFDTIDTMIFWFDMMKSRSDLKVYGYSKSWEIFLEYQTLELSFPTNYVLNLSSGSKYSETSLIYSRMKQLPIVRGSFSAIQAPADVSVRDVAKSFGLKRLFVCPGKCGNCLKVKNSNVHACGSMLLKNTNIVIKAH